jgi:hypothetical protein
VNERLGGRRDSNLSALQREHHGIVVLQIEGIVVLIKCSHNHPGDAGGGRTAGENQFPLWTVGISAKVGDRVVRWPKTDVTMRLLGVSDAAMKESSRTATSAVSRSSVLRKPWRSKRTWYRHRGLLRRRSLAMPPCAASETVA